MTQQTIQRPPADALPAFEIEFAAPDLRCWHEGNTGVSGFWQFDGPEPGPHVVVTALMHGNEIAGAMALDRKLRAQPSPLRGRLTLGFVNLDAYERFDPAHPTLSRYSEEDMNRLWEPSVLDGPRHSRELSRARAIRPIVDAADILLDLHSMLWPSDPLILCGPTPKGRALACRIGVPDLVVADHGHASGRRLIDYAPFADQNQAPVAVLVEAGPHWCRVTVETMCAAIDSLLASTGLSEPVPAASLPAAAPLFAPSASRFAEVTMAVTAASGGFSFVQPFRGGHVVPRRHTLIAMDGPTEIRTPHDDCLLIMPSLRPSRGHTAVRLARFA